MIVVEFPVTTVELTRQIPRAMTPTQHSVTFALCPDFMIGHYTWKTWCVKESLIGEGYVDKCGTLGGAKGIS